MNIWTTKEGKKIPFSELEDSHLLNIKKYIERKAKEGVTLCAGGGWADIEEIWYDEWTIYGKEVFNHYKYYEIIKEIKKRGLEKCQISV